MSLRDLSDVLWRERQLLDLLLYKLETERLFTDQSQQWMSQATREVRSVAELLRLVDLERATLSVQTAVSLGCRNEAVLAELSEAAPEPWSGILARHRDALLRGAQLVTNAAAASHARLVSALDGSIAASQWAELSGD